MQRSVLTVSALFAAAMLFAPAALAERPDDRGGAIGVGSVTVPAAEAVRPDDQAGPRGPGAVSVSSKKTVASATRPDDRAGVRGPGATLVGSTVLVSSDGFDWSDAGIGVAGGLGLALIAAGLLATTTRSHRMQRLA